MESTGGWEGALSVARRADFPAERKRPRVGRLRAESWHLEKEKNAEKRRSDAHRAASGVSGDIKCGAFKIQAARDTHGELRNPDTRSKNTHVGFSFFSFFSSQIKVMSIQIGRGALERGVRNRAWVPLRTRSALWAAVFIPRVKCLFPAAPAAKHIYLWRKLFVPMETVLIVIRIFFFPIPKTTTSVELRRGWSNRYGAVNLSCALCE